MKTIEELDIDTPLLLEEFLLLFSHLPLTDEEKRELNEVYFKMYITFLEAETSPKDSWLATKNIFIIKNQQIAERVKANKSE